MPVFELARVVHGQHVAVLGLGRAALWHADHLYLQFGDLGPGQRGSGESQQREYTAKRHFELTKSCGAK